MRRIQKLLAGTLLGGVLLTGIGTGVALVEYSSFAYAGEKLIGADNLEIREIDFKFEPEQGKIVIVHGYWDRKVKGNILEEDDSIPEGTIRYVVTHNPDMADVALHYEENPERERGIQGYLNLQIRYIGDDWKVFLESKDEILKELKQKQIASFDVAYITDVKIKVNPKTIPLLEYDIY